MGLSNNGVAQQLNDLAQTEVMVKMFKNWDVRLMSIPGAQPDRDNHED